MRLALRAVEQLPCMSATLELEHALSGPVAARTNALMPSPVAIFTPGSKQPQNRCTRPDHRARQ